MSSVMTDWTFLDPWRAALSANRERGYSREMLVSFKWRPISKSYCPKLGFTIDLEEGNPQNASKLNEIREAIELFFALSIVNNKAFTEQLAHLSWSMRGDEQNWYPEWNLDIRGPATVQQDAWSSLLMDFSPSSQFQHAMQALRAMGLNEMCKDNMFYYTELTWSCKFDGGDAEAILKFDEGDGIETNFRGMFNASASMMMHAVLTRDNTTLDDIWQHPHVPRLVNLAVSLHNLATPFSRYLAVGLVYTPINRLRVDIGQEQISNNTQATINAGVLLSRIYQWSRVISTDVSISCYRLFGSVFAAICSTIAVQSTTTPINLTIQPVRPGSLSWLVYAVFCSPAAEISLCIGRMALSKTDLLSIADVLKYNYPLSKNSEKQLQSRAYQASEFGFVDIEEGTTVWPIDLEEDATFAVPCRVRCRAWFKEDYLEVVVPGLGLCRIGDGVYEAFHDSEEQKSQVIRSLRSLSLHNTSIESISPVMELLKLIGGNLLSLRLSLMQEYRHEVTLDLSVLSGICPSLKLLKIRKFDLVVSNYNESLYLWPIKTLEIRKSRTLTDLTLCLRNPKVLMARELEKLKLEFYDAEYDARDLHELMAHDENVLPVVMEKFPLQSKAALVSVVNGDNYMMGIPHFHADMLELIFIFASTPARRSVSIWCPDFIYNI